MKDWIAWWAWSSCHLKLRERRMIMTTILCVIVAAGCMAMSPLLLARLIDGLLAGRPGSGGYTMLLVFGYLATIATPRIIGVVVLQLQNRLRIYANSSLLAAYFNYLCEQPDSFFAKRNGGELSQEIAQASNDLYIIIRSLSSSAIAPLVQICIAVAVLATNRNVIMAGMISVYVALFLANHRVQGRKLSELRRGLMGAGRRTYATLVDSISNIHVARQTRRHFGAANRSLRKSMAPVDFDGSAGAASAVDVSAGRALRA